VQLSSRQLSAQLADSLESVRKAGLQVGDVLTGPDQLALQPSVLALEVGHRNA
jgi:hypothetical protein